MKKTKISFDFDADSTSAPEVLEDILVPVTQNYYLKRVRTIAGVKRFGIPTEIKRELDLTVSDDIYFVEYPEGYYVVFNSVPDTKLYRKRKLIKAGAADSLYTAIPPFITNYYDKPITAVKLIRPKDLPINTWRLQLIFTEFT